MADDLSTSQMATFNSVLSGTALSQIQQLKSQAASLQQAISDMKLSGKSTAAADQSILAMRQAINQAINDHNKIAGWIQTATGQKIGMAGMASLGVVPAVVWTIAAIAGGLVALSFVLDSLAKSLAAAQGKNIETRGYIDQIGGAIGSTSSLVANVGIIAAVGFGLYVVYQVLKKRSVV